MRAPSNISHLVLAALVVLLGVSPSSTAFAQQDVIDLEESVIEGRIQKPEAFYILQPAELDYEAFDENPTFLDELLETVKQEPF